jgi:hypothetical protein
MSETLERPATADKGKIIDALGAWIRQRSGMDFRNYGDLSAYRSESRSITRDLHDARTLLRYVSMSQITGEQLTGAFRAFSGRLSWDGERLDYCTGQYFPTEYRKAACAVLASAIWGYWRDGLTGEDLGGKLRRSASNTFGRGIQSRWFR